MEQILYGAAYYEEYLPEDCLAEDMQWIQEAGMNVIRIAESTWSSCEPQEGVFDFDHVVRVIEEAARHGISVIVGTPTYAIPPWLAYKYPEILARTEQGLSRYGARQLMDITNPQYLFYAERIIRRLMEQVSGYENVIGYQLDNETKHYHVAGENVQKRFVEHLKKTFVTVERMNQEFGFAYWSNRVDDWAHVPDVTGTVNGSFWGEFEKFRRSLVDEFLLWQRQIVDSYRRPDQFVTHNFDFEWRGHSFGLQPDVNHFHAAEAVTIAGCDIYHETQEKLTGKEAAFCGAITRALKEKNYLVMETAAQGPVEWTPFEGQLKMQCFSHLANGADGVMYWHFHTTYNGKEAYWRGILGHDRKKNRFYREIADIGQILHKIGPELLHIRKENKVAILVSNEALTGLSGEPMFPFPDQKIQYNDIVREYADVLYELNIEYDILSPEKRNFSRYRLVLVPVLYSAPEPLLHALDQYVEEGGTLLVTFRSCYTNEFYTIGHYDKPHILERCLGITYQEYTVPNQVGLTETEWFACSGCMAQLSGKEREAELWMELLQPKKGEAIPLVTYEHANWGGYAAVTENPYGAGKAYYVGCGMQPALLKCVLRYVAKQAEAVGVEQEAEFPICIQKGVSSLGKRIYYYFNYSSKQREQKFLHGTSIELLEGKRYRSGETIHMLPWSVYIFREEQEDEKQ